MTLKVPLLPVGDGTVTAKGPDIEFLLWDSSGPLDASGALTENSSYLLTVNAPNAKKPELLVGGLVASGEFRRTGSQLTGEVALGNEFGVLELTLVDQAVEVCTAWIEVRPKYLDLEQDFQAMQADIQEITNGFSYSLWRQTFLDRYPDAAKEGAEIEWIFILRSLWRRIATILQSIERDPQDDLLWTREVVPAGRARSVDAASLRWLAKRSDVWEPVPAGSSVPGIRIGDQVAAPRMADVPRAAPTYDVPANRALKEAIVGLERRVRRGARAAEALPLTWSAVQQRSYLQQLGRISRQARRFARAPFLSEVSDAPGLRHTRIHAAIADARYRTLFQLIDLLEWGLVDAIKGPPAQAALKETWQLYEYWAYLYVVGLFVSAGWRIDRNDLLRKGADRGTLLLLSADRETTCVFTQRRGPGEMSRVSLTYHRKLGADQVLTIERDVDIFLDATGPGGHIRVVFDPKYRCVRSGSSGPLTCPSSAVDDMHVYRDSIGSWAPKPGGGRLFSRFLDGAFAIFPSHDEQTFASNLYSRRVADGVGAFPLLPGGEQAPKLLRDWFVEMVGLDLAAAISPGA